MLRLPSALQPPLGPFPTLSFVDPFPSTFFPFWPSDFLSHSKKCPLECDLKKNSTKLQMAGHNYHPLQEYLNFDSQKLQS